MYTIGNTLEMSAGKYPRRPALIYPEKNQHWTYREWDNNVNRLANAFLKLGTVKGDRVSTFLTNTSELVSVLFAAAKTGAVFNPINCNLSPAELAFILNDAEAKVLVYGKSEKKRVERARSKIKTVKEYLYVDEDPPEFAIPYYQLIRSFSETKPNTYVSENDWYSIIYTSGTTGKPKGVIHRHREIIDHSMCMIESQKLTCYDRGLSVAPLYHAAELHCFFIPRVHIGATNVIIKNFDPRAILQAMKKEKITVMFADPSRWRVIVQHVKGRCNLSHFRLLASGGAPMPPVIARKCRDVFGTDIIHYYGMTEMGPAVSVLYPDEQMKKAGSAGKALLNHEIRVVRIDDIFPPDPEDVVDPGTKGEIIVRGVGMMQGYYNRPELTAEALYGGWYHSGDIGSFDSEGYLWIFDRLDEMIISGVDNIYPREIEEVLLENPDILEAAVFGVENEQGETEIVALIVSDNKSLTAREVDTFLRESDKLADFKIPKRYKFVNELPKLTTGKIPKRHLAKKYNK